MRIEPEFGGASLVMLGNFNPTIFTPAWFALNGILTARQAEAAEVEIVHSQVSSFRVDWLMVRVEQGRFWAETNEAPYIRISDFACRTFGEFLPHTPVSRLGINRMVHFNVGSIATRHRIGRKLAPPQAWGKWGNVLIDGPPEKQGGLVSLSMQKDLPDDRPAGYIQVTVQPSIKIAGSAGIYMLVNDDYQLRDPDKVVGCGEILRILTECFESSIQRSEAIIDGIMALKAEVENAV